MKRKSGHWRAGLRCRVGADDTHCSIRRKLLIALVAGALAAPLSSYAQPQGKVWRVGILDSGAAATGNDPYKAFVAGLRDLGYSEGRNVAIARRFADGKPELLMVRAAELARLKVDVIVTQGTPAVSAAYAATKTIPIVAGSFADPVGSGFATSLARPGGNITGLSNVGEEIYAKRLEMLMSAAPKVVRVAYLVNPDNTASMRMRSGLEAGAHKIGKAIVVVEARTASDFAAAFSRMTRERAGALIVADDALLNAQGARIAELALQNRLPSIFAFRPSVEAGGLMSYGFDPNVSFLRVAVFVDKIFKGAKPGDLPIEQPMTFDLVINRRTAKALGITFPPSIVVLSNKVIE